MQVTLGRFAFAGAAVALLSSLGPWARPAWADLDEQAASYTFHFFSDADGITASTHAGGYEFALTSGIQATVDWARDLVVFPAVDAPQGSSEAVDAISSASRPITGDADPYQEFVKVRSVAQGAVTWSGTTASYYVSSESDYFARMAALGWNRDFLGENLNIAVSTSYGWDDIEPFADDDGDTANDSQISRHWSVVGTHVMTPTTVVRLGLELNRVSGLQHDPYRSVYVAGGYVPERHPGSRDRRAAFASVSQYLPNRSSVKVDYRRYTDDWDVASHTIGGRLAQRINEAVSIRYRYRFYHQGPAFFHRDEYPDPDGVEGYRTLDYRLGEFGSHLFGGHVYWDTDGLFGAWPYLRETHIGVGWDRYFNSNNFTANVIETTLEVGF